MVGALATTAMVWQREYPLDPYYDTLMTAAANLYNAATRTNERRPAA